MAVTGAPIDVVGLVPLVRALKGPLFRDVNNSLRAEALLIAERMEPEARIAVSRSRAPQAAAMVNTVRAKRDRVPAIAVGAVNPKFRRRVGRKPPFTRSGTGALAHRLRRGAIAHGVVYGTKGGHMRGGGDYYGIPRNDDGGPVGAYLKGSRFTQKLGDEYMEAYMRVLREAGFTVKIGRVA